MNTAQALLLVLVLTLTCPAAMRAQPARSPASLPVAAQPQPPPRPDILFIMPDQMRGDCLSLLGHPVLRTPHMDQLAREGTLFRRAYSTCPSCIPARFSLLTGLYPSTSGVVGFKARPIIYPTLPQLLVQAGYTTILDGRNMHQVPPNATYGFEREITATAYVSRDDYDTFLRHAASETGGIGKLIRTLGLSMNGWEAKPWPLEEKLHPTDWVVSQGRAMLEQMPLQKPLFLTVSFFTPHPPLYPPKKYFDYYYAQQLPAPAHGDWVDWHALSPKGDAQGHRVLLTGEPLRRAQAGYFGLIEHLDNRLGPLIAQFKARSQKAHRPWLVALTSDHGEMLGDHGYYRKCEPYEGSANIPYLIAGSPELGFKAGQRSTSPVCLEDLMPTLLALAGVQPPALMDGMNLVPVLRGEQQTVREWLHFEHAECYSKAQEFQALTDGHTKYIWRPEDGTEQLFDLDHDPREEHELAADRAHRSELEACRARMISQLINRPEGFTDGQRLFPGRPYPPLQQRNSRPG